MAKKSEIKFKMSWYRAHRIARNGSAESNDAEIKKILKVKEGDPQNDQ